jgi:hypothetical protein
MSISVDAITAAIFATTRIKAAGEIAWRKARFPAEEEELSTDFADFTDGIFLSAFSAQL